MTGGGALSSSPSEKIDDKEEPDVSVSLSLDLNGFRLSSPASGLRPASGLGSNCRQIDFSSFGGLDEKIGDMTDLTMAFVMSESTSP